MHINWFQSFLVLALVAMTLWACSDATDATGDNANATDSLDGAVAEPDPCEDATIICTEGLNFVRLGDFLAQVGPQELFDAGKVRDTLASGNGYIWIVRTLEFEDGEVIIEGEFIDDRDITQEKVDASTVNRIQVKSPAFETAQGLKVGSTFGELRETFADSTMYVDAIPEYKAVVVQVQGLPLFFNFIESTPELSTRTDGTLTPEMIPADMEVASIVVM